MDNGEYLCEEACNDKYQYKDQVTIPNRCINRCPEYAYFLDIDDDNNKECKKECPIERSFVNVYLQEDKSYVCT